MLAVAKPPALYYTSWFRRGTSAAFFFLQPSTHTHNTKEVRCHRASETGVCVCVLANDGREGKEAKEKRGGGRKEEPHHWGVPTLPTRYMDCRLWAALECLYTSPWNIAEASLPIATFKTALPPVQEGARLRRGDGRKICWGKKHTLRRQASVAERRRGGERKEKGGKGREREGREGGRKRGESERRKAR